MEMTLDWSLHRLHSDGSSLLLLSWMGAQELGFVISNEYSILWTRPYLKHVVLPWFLLRGFSLRFTAGLQPAVVSLQLGPHFGGK